MGVCKQPRCFSFLDPVFFAVYGIMMSISRYYKHPYEPISIMECYKGFERCSHLCEREHACMFLVPLSRHF